MVSLEEGMRSEALQVLTFWEHVVQIFGPASSEVGGSLSRVAGQSSCVGGYADILNYYLTNFNVPQHELWRQREQFQRRRR